MSESSAPENAPAPETPDLTALNKRLDDALAELDTQRRRVKRSSIISTCVGGALLALLTAYFTVGYVKILEFVNKPEEAVALVGQTMEDMLPDVRKQIETMIIEGAPEWAKMASEELLASAPDIREQLEGLILDQSKLLVEQLSGFSEQRFAEFLETQRPTFEATIRELSSTQQEPEETFAELTEALENELKVNMEEEARTLLDVVYALNEKLRKLSDGRDLTREESYLRRAMMILRRVQLEQANPEFKGKKWTLNSEADPSLVEETPDKPDEKPEPEAPKEAEPKKEDAAAPEAKEEAKPKEEAPPAKAKEEPKAETPAPEPKEKPKPKAEPAPKAEEEPKAKTEDPEPAKADAEKPEAKTE